LFQNPTRFSDGGAGGNGAENIHLVAGPTFGGDDAGG